MVRNKNEMQRYGYTIRKMRIAYRAEKERALAERILQGSS
jgi:hypothetical protein